jgi:N-acetylglucosamine-6-phosphate deacetylase
MNGGHHRYPGVVGAGLTRDEVAIEIIPDLTHVHPGAIEIALRSKPDGQVMLVTDAIPPAGLGDGKYELQNQQVEVIDGVCREAKTGNLAGSTVTMVQGIKNLIETLELDLQAAIRMASTNPAEIHGLTDRGRIEPGHRADLTVFDDNLDLLETIVGGRSVYSR